MMRKTFRPIRNHVLTGRTISFDAADPLQSRVSSISGLPSFGAAFVWKRCEDFIVLERKEKKIPMGVTDCAGCAPHVRSVPLPATFYLLELEGATIRCVFNETKFERKQRPNVELAYETDVLSLGECQPDECCHTVSMYQRC